MGLDVELAAEPFDGGVEAQTRFGFFDVDAPESFPGAGELVLEAAALVAQGVELVGGDPGRFGLAAAAVAEPVVEGVDAAAVLGEATGHGGEGLVASEELEAVLLGGGLGLGVAGREAGLDLGEARREEGAAFVGGGAAELRGPGRGERGAGGFDGAFRLGA